MKLSDYLNKHSLTHAEFGGQVGVDRATVTRWVSGRSRPDWNILHKIAEVTGGKVTADDFVPEPAKGAA